MTTHTPGPHTAVTRSTPTRAVCKCFRQGRLSPSRRLSHRLPRRPGCSSTSRIHPVAARCAGRVVPLVRQPVRRRSRSMRHNCRKRPWRRSTCWRWATVSNRPSANSISLSPGPPPVNTDDFEAALAHEDSSAASMSWPMHWSSPKSSRRRWRNGAFFASLTAPPRADAGQRSSACPWRRWHWQDRSGYAPGKVPRRAGVQPARR